MIMIDHPTYPMIGYNMLQQEVLLEEFLRSFIGFPVGSKSLLDALKYLRAENICWKALAQGSALPGIATPY